MSARPLVLLVCLGACAPTLLLRARGPGGAPRVEVVAAGRRQRVVINGQSHPESDAVAVERLVLGDDGRTVAWPSLRGGRWRVSVNGREGEPWEGVGELALAPDGRLAYAAVSGGRWRVVVDGRAGEGFDAIVGSSLRWGPSGRRVFYLARDGGAVIAVLDGVRAPPATAVRQVRFGDKGALAAWVARGPSGERVVINGSQGPLFREVVSVAAAASAPAVAWVGVDLRGWTLVRDGAEVARSAEAIDELRLSADGAHLAWLRVDGAAVEVVRDGAVVGRHDDVVGRSLAMSADGAHLVWVGVDGGWRRVVRDGVAGPEYDAVTELRARPDGRYGYVARRGEVYTAVVDGRRVRRARAWLGGLMLPDAGPRFALFAALGAQHAVIDDRGARVVGHALLDSLAFDHGGGRWGCLAGPPDAPVGYVFDDGARAPLDWHELGSMVVRAEPEAARHLVRAELGRRAR